MYLPQMLRYIPGRILMFLGYVHFAEKAGLNKAESSLLFFLSQLLASLPGLLLVELYLALTDNGPRYDAYDILVLPTAILLLVTLSIVGFPERFRSLVNSVLKILRLPPVEIQIEWQVILRVAVSYFITWNLYGFAFYLFLRAIFPEQTLTVMEIVGAWTLGYLVGYWAVFLPAGIGAREAVLLVLLTPAFAAHGTPELAGVAVIGARAWSIVGEMICTVVAWRVKRRDR